jgi:serine/threonine protein kinase
MAMAVGQLLDEQYEVLVVYGEGPDSTVYRAREVLTGSICSIRVFSNPAAKELSARFEAESQKLRKLDHPNVVKFRTFGLTRTREPYLVYDDARGRSLAKVLEEMERVPVPQAVRMFQLICDGLGIAHHLGIHHRNLKPTKVIITSEANTPLALKITDFGITAILRSDYTHIANLTTPGSTVASPHYMSPEQCMARATDERADIYALGCIMYRTLTGYQAFSGKNAIEVLAKHINASPPGFSKAVPELEISSELEKIVFRCLEKNPEDRFASVSELRRALENFDEKGTAGSAVLYVSIPDQQGASGKYTRIAKDFRPSAEAMKSLESHELKTKGKPDLRKEVSSSYASLASGQTPTGDEGDSAAGDASSGSDSSKVRHSRPSPASLNGRQNNLKPILILAVLLGLGSVGAAMFMKHGAITVAPIPAAKAGFTKAQLSTITPPDFASLVYPRLPDSTRELFENEATIEAQADEGGANGVMKKLVLPAIADSELVLGKDSVEMIWLKSRLVDLLMVNEYVGEAQELAEEALKDLETKHQSIPTWLVSRLRAAIITSCLANGKATRAVDEMMVLCQGKELRRPTDTEYKLLLEGLQNNGKELSLLISSSQIGDSVIEEKLESIYGSAATLRSRSFELKSYSLWYLLMVGLNKRNNEKIIKQTLYKFNELTRPVLSADMAVGYMLFAASHKARETGLDSIAALIDETAVERLVFFDQRDPLYLQYKRLYPRGIKGLIINRPERSVDGDKTESITEDETKVDTAKPKKPKN